MLRNIKQLNRDYALNDGMNEIFFQKGDSEFPFIQINTRHADATISLYGGQVLAFKPRSQVHDLVFVSPNALHQHGKAIRGGIPVCAPWFGSAPAELNAPSHGFARLQLWSVRETSIDMDGVARVMLTLQDSPETYEVWPHGIQWELVITVGKTLHLQLTTRNTGHTTFKLTQALHTYFAVGDVEQAYILGLDGVTYFDNAAQGHGELKQQIGTVGIHEEVDRIYTESPAEIQLLDGVWNRRISITASGSHSTVVWNPWEVIAAKMADLPDAAYRDFVCIETSNAAADVITLAAGAEHQLAVEYSIESL